MAVSTVAVATFFVGATALSASAHTPDVQGIASCESDGTYSVTWTYTASSVPDGVEDEAKVIKHEPVGTLINGDDGQYQLSSWTTHQGNTGAGPVEVGNWSTTYTQTKIPGSATSASSDVQSDWNDGVSGEAYGTVTLDGTCMTPPPPAEKVASASVSTTPPTCTSPETLVYGEIKNADFSGSPDGLKGPAPYDVVATAHSDSKFAGEKDQKEFTGTLSGPLSKSDCTITPVVPVLHEPTCTDSTGSIAVPAQPTGVVVTREGDTVTFAPAAGYFFPEGTVTSYTLETPPTFVDCNAPPSPKVTETYQYTVDCDYVLTTVTTTTSIPSVSNGDGSAYVDGAPVVTTTSATQTVDAAYLTAHNIPQPADCVTAVTPPSTTTATPAPVAYTKGTSSLAETGKTMGDYGTTFMVALGALAVLLMGALALVISSAVRRRHAK